MKKSIIYLAVLLAGMSSCKDFLTEEPVLSQSNELTLAKFLSGHGHFASIKDYILCGNLKAGIA